MVGFHYAVYASVTEWAACSNSGFFLQVLSLTCSNSADKRQLMGKPNNTAYMCPGGKPFSKGQLIWTGSWWGAAVIGGLWWSMTCVSLHFVHIFYLGFKNIMVMFFTGKEMFTKCKQQVALQSDWLQQLARAPTSSGLEGRHSNTKYDSFDNFRCTSRGLDLKESAWFLKTYYF